ncbi:MAG: choice-of-anchor B family protein [Planctomycetes bacterium]|nr:choice-of-anchor B family protein [Planctomycetota bacterium]
MRVLLPMLAVAGLASTLFAQGVNCTLLGTFNHHGPFNDVWGYTAPNGDEYALLGTTTGTVVVDVSDPANPVERGFFAWTSSPWRDIRTYGPYAYVGTEAGQGFQILSLASPNSPSAIGVFGASHSNNSHNVCIDTGAGRLYLAGCNSGTPVYDLAANPTDPPFLGFAYGSSNSEYFHDLCVENGYGYGSMIYNGYLRIFDVSTFPPTTVSNTNTPGSFAHNAWPNAGGTIVATTDEVTGGVVKFFDTTNKNSPQPLGQFTPNPGSIPHNAYIIGNVCHVSWYTEGYQLIDISNPATPVAIASYDTWPGSSGGFNGCWGCYPFLPSGNVLLSDRSTGLYIVKPNITDLAMAHTPLADTTDEDGPYTATATVTTSHPIGSITTYWREGSSGAFQALAMNPAGPPDVYAADIPGHDAVTEIEYYVEAFDLYGSARSPSNGVHRFLVGSVNELFFDDFESDLGWTHGAYSVEDDWERGVPNGQSGTSGGLGWQDPTMAFSGTRCYANDLGNGTNGSYSNANANWLRSPPIATNGLQNIRLQFRRWLQMYPGDIATVRINGALAYANATGNNDSSWQAIDLDISAISNSASSIVVSFELQTDGAGVSGGWAVDDVRLVQISDSAPPKLYGVGTAGTNGVPTIALAGRPCLGATVQVQGGNILANAPVFRAFGIVPDNTPVFGITSLVASPVVTFATASAAGDVAFPLAVPNDPAIDNLYIYAQLLPVDAGSPMGLAATEGLRFRICLQ